MGMFFSDKVEKALHDIYYDLAAGRGQEGFQLLQEACNEGDADAYCLLARCLYGDQYTWVGHNFPVDEREGDELMRRSVLLGSALGVLVSMRCGVMDDELKETMPFASLKEAFEIILDKAERGEPFCQMVIGNVYYWWDFMEIEKIDPKSFETDEDFRNFLRENILKCEYWYTKALDNGLATAGANLSLLYLKGEDGLIDPQPQKAQELTRHYADKGYPNYQYLYACDLYDEDKLEEAYALFRKAAAAGEPRAYFFAGYAYELGYGVPQDYARAAEFYRMSINSGISVKEGSYNRLGALYFNGNGVEQDYNKAFHLIKMADDRGTTGNWGAYYLGYCYAYGRGTEQNYALARKYLETIDWDCPDGFFILGWLYCNGEGGPEDIAKGVEYLQKAGDSEEVLEELSHYKKNFFGKWVRRDTASSLLGGLISMFQSGENQAPPIPQPHDGWEWTLTINSRQKNEELFSPSYQQILEELRQLIPDPDSFIILEQKNPKNTKEYWFIQCAIATKGETKGSYIVEVGFKQSGQAELWETTVTYLTDAAAYFEAACKYEKINFSGFTKIDF